MRPLAKNDEGDQGCPEKEQADELGRRKGPLEYEPSGIAPIELDNEAGDRVEPDVGPEDLAIETLPGGQPHEKTENQELGACFVELGGMESDAQGHSHNLMRVVIREGDAQERARRLAVATSRRETSQTTDAVPQRDGWRQDVRHPPGRQPVFPAVPEGGEDGGHQTAIEDSTRAQETPRIVLVVFPVHHQQQEFGPPPRGYQYVQPEVHRHARLDANLLCSPRRQFERDEEPDG